jgi:RNA polymerase sigma factor (sigma-70 family)
VDQNTKEGLVSKEHFALVRSLARSAKRRCRSNSIDLEELENEGFLALYDAARLYQPNLGPFRNFAAKRVRGRLIDFIRKNSGRGSVEIVERPDTAIHPDQQVIQHQRRKHLRTAVHELPERERKAIVCRYRDESSFVEIGQELGVSKVRAIQIHQNALRRLRPLIRAAAA